MTRFVWLLLASLMALASASTNTPSVSPVSGSGTPAPSSSGTPAYTGPPGSYSPCNICGNVTGATIANPSVPLTFQSFPSFTCLELFNAGVNGQINSAFCPELQSPSLGVSDQCGCGGPATSSPTTSPTSSSLTFAPSPTSAASPVKPSSPSSAGSPSSQANSAMSPATSASSQQLLPLLSISVAFVAGVIRLF